MKTLSLGAALALIAGSVAVAPLPAVAQSRNSWVNQSRVFARHGLTGPQSCSAVGPGGYTGCALQEIHDAANARASDVRDDTPPPK